MYFGDKGKMVVNFMIFVIYGYSVIVKVVKFWLYFKKGIIFGYLKSFFNLYL